MNYEVNEAFDLVIPSRQTGLDGIDVCTDYSVTYPHIIQLNPMKKWEMGLLELSIPGRARSALKDQLWFRITLTNEAKYANNKFKQAMNAFHLLPHAQKIFVPPDIVEKDDSVLIYQFFKRSLNDYKLGYEGVQGTTNRSKAIYKFPIEVQLIMGKVQFVFKEDLFPTINIVDETESRNNSDAKGWQCNACRIEFSIPMSYLLGLNNFGSKRSELELFDTRDYENAKFIAKRYAEMWHSTTPEDIFDMWFMKEDITKTVKGSRLKCKSRLQTHIYPHSIFNIECTLLDSNFVGGVHQRERTLRRISLTDVEKETYTQVFESKNVLYMPMEQLVFQTIGIRLINEEDQAISLVNPSSVTDYVGQTIITVRIRPSI